MTTVLVVRGTVDVPDVGAIGKQREIERLGVGFGARTWAHTRRYHVGERITLKAEEAARLIALGVCRLE